MRTQNQLKQNKTIQQQQKMSIHYQKGVAPLEAQCCFMPTAQTKPRNKPFVPQSSTSYNYQQMKTEFIRSPQTKPINKNDQSFDTQSMKKSISSMNLKRKMSSGYRTNKTSIQQSQFIEHKKNSERRFITHSMDSEVFKQYLPQNQEVSAFGSGRGNASVDKKAMNKKNGLWNAFQGIINQQQDTGHCQIASNNNFQTLEDLALKFEKNRNAKNEIKGQQTIKKQFVPENLHLQKTIPRNSSQQHPQSFNYKQGHFSGNQYENPEYQKFNGKYSNQQSNQSNQYLKIPQYGVSNEYSRFNHTEEFINKGQRQNQNQTAHNEYHQKRDFQFNQIDSMIIQVPQGESDATKQHYKKPSSSNLKVPQFLKNKNGKNSGGYKEDIDRTKKYPNKRAHQGMHWVSQKELFNDDVVLSDYEEDDHKGEKKERMEESAVMMNFFNPSEALREKLGLAASSANNASRN